MEVDFGNRQSMWEEVYRHEVNSLKIFRELLRAKAPIPSRDRGVCVRLDREDDNTNARDRLNLQA